MKDQSSGAPAWTRSLSSLANATPLWDLDSPPHVVSYNYLVYVLKPITPLQATKVERCGKYRALPVFGR